MEYMKEHVGTLSDTVQEAFDIVEEDDRDGGSGSEDESGGEWREAPGVARGISPYPRSRALANPALLAR